MRALLYVAAVASGAIVAGALVASGVASCCRPKLSGDAFFLILFASAALAAWPLWGGGPKSPSRFPLGPWLGCVLLVGVAFWTSVRTHQSETKLRELEERERGSSEWFEETSGLAEGLEVDRAARAVTWFLAGLSIANLVAMSTRRRAEPPPR